jgi:hypothetical protein
MLLTILLAKVFGLYMLIAGLAMLTNRSHMMLAIVALAKDRGSQLVAGTVALFFGLLIVNIHNVWGPLPASLVSLIGWLGVLKGIAYLALPEAKLTKLMHMVSERKWYMVDVAIAVVIGLYLTGFGFGWF